VLLKPKSETAFRRPASRPVADNILPDLSGGQQDQPLLVLTKTTGQLRQQGRPRRGQRGRLTGKDPGQRLQPVCICRAETRPGAVCPVLARPR